MHWVLTVTLLPLHHLWWVTSRTCLTKHRPQTVGHCADVTTAHTTALLRRSLAQILRLETGLLLHLLLHPADGGVRCWVVFTLCHWYTVVEPQQCSVVMTFWITTNVRQSVGRQKVGPCITIYSSFRQSRGSIVAQGVDFCGSVIVD